MSETADHKDMVASVEINREAGRFKLGDGVQVTCYVPPNPPPTPPRRGARMRTRLGDMNTSPVGRCCRNAFRARAEVFNCKQAARQHRPAIGRFTESIRDFQIRHGGLVVLGREIRPAFLRVSFRRQVINWEKLMSLL